MDFSRFSIEREKRIEEIKKEEWEETRVIGIRPDPGLINKRGGFYLSLIFPDSIAQKAAAFSAKVGNIIPAMVYRQNDVHITIGWITESVQNYFYFDDTLKSHREHLARVIDIAKQVAETTSPGQCQVNFGHRPFMKTTGILTVGDFSQSILDMAVYVSCLGEEHNVITTSPFVTHSSLSRFTEAKSADQIQELFNLVDTEAPLGLVKPIGISAGYTLRDPSDRNVADLRDSPGHFYGVKFFPFK